MSEIDYRTVAEWALGDNTGSSSKCMARHLSGFPADRWKSHPHDSGDFERCLGLLHAVPAFRERLGDMATVSAYWAALVKNWTRIEGAAPKMRYKVMRSILDPIEKQDSSVIRLGKGASIRFSP